MTTSQFGGLNGSDLARAKQFVARAKLGDGTFCPCCEQMVKAYKRTVTSTMAQWLIGLVRRYQRETRFYSVNEDWSLAINRGTGDVAKLRHWGLIVPKEKSEGDAVRRTSGLWIPSRDGILFAHGKITVDRWAITFNAKVLGFEGGPWSIRQALGRHFNFDRLMAGEL